MKARGTYFILFFLLLKYNCIGQSKINDTLFFVRNINEDFSHFIFIDTNKQSAFYKMVADFNFDQFDVDTYKSSLAYLSANKLIPKKHSISNFPREWVQLVSFKKVIYVYKPNDFYYHLKIKLTDSVFIYWGGEGPEANYMQQFQKLDSVTYEFKLRSNWPYKSIVTIKILDQEKGIAVFRFQQFDQLGKLGNVYYQLMGDVSKMQKIPLLVNDSDRAKQYEVDEDNIDYSKYFKVKK
jgi:hypothetical protein